jgi:acetyltransferase EpsM
MDASAPAGEAGGHGERAVSGPVELVVVGGGEHGRVVMDAARSRPDMFRLAGFLDPATCAETTRRFGVPHLGGDDRVTELAAIAEVGFVLGLGAVGVRPQREQLVARLDAKGARWVAVVHAQACVSTSATVADGAVVMAGATVNTGARLGRHVVVNTSAVVEHDVELDDFAQVGPAAALGGAARVGRGSYLGLGARVRDHVTIGSGVTVGMGAVVISSVADGEIVMGVPARVRRVGGRA